MEDPCSFLGNAHWHCLSESRCIGFFVRVVSVYSAPRLVTCLTLASVTVAPQVLPRMTERFSAWDPLADPAWGTADMAVWRPLLESESQRDAIFQVPRLCHESQSAVCCVFTFASPICFLSKGQMMHLPDGMQLSMA